eukprot:11782647-Karenia_brevis.AAC.1
MRVSSCSTLTPMKVSVAPLGRERLYQPGYILQVGDEDILPHAPPEPCSFIARHEHDNHAYRHPQLDEQYSRAIELRERDRRAIEEVR